MLRSQAQSPVPRALITEALAGLRAATQAGEASFWCLSEDGGAMELAVNLGPQAALLETLSVPLADSVVGLVQATRMATAIGPGDAHHGSVDAATGVTTRAMVAVPVLGATGLLGVLSAINPEGRERFGGACLASAMAAASALAGRLEAGAGMAARG